MEIEGEKVSEDSTEKKVEKVIYEERKIEIKSTISKHSEDSKEEKVPVLNINKHVTILIEEKPTKKENDQLIVP